MGLMKVSSQYSREHEDSMHREREIIDLLRKQGLQSQIDIVLEQGSHSKDSHDTEGDIGLEIEGIEGDERCAPVTFDSACDYPSSQPKTTEVLFDDEFVVLNGEYRSSITGFHLGQTFQPGNVRTWVPKLVAKRYMQSAKQGNSRAQYRLGCMYARGFGVKQNYIMAYTWCKISASQHSPRGLLKLKEIERRLTTAHIYYASNLSRRYYEMYVVPFLH
jgi:hypothetical protein